MNLVSCMRATRLLLPMLLEAAASDKRGATLVFISSMIALNTAVAPGHSAYIASKTVSPFAGFPSLGSLRWVPLGQSGLLDSLRGW